MSENSGKRKIVLKNVRIFDGEGIKEPSTVVIDGGIIGKPDDTEDAEVIDGKGCVLLPGFIDAHVHLHGEENLFQLASYGVTTALDMGNGLDVYEPLRARKGLTDVRSALTVATSPGSRHSKLFAHRGIPESELVSNPEDARNFVARRVAEGSDYIKIIADVPGPDQASLNALAAAAHSHGKLVVAHATAYIPCQMAQEAGVDVLTHAPVDRAFEKADVDRMIDDKRVIVPTLTVIETLLRNVKRPGADYSHGRETVRALYRAGVPVLAGTDANQAPALPFNVAHGESLHRELELLVDAGLSTVDTLRAATSLPAKHFGLNDRGVIEPGYRADLVLIDGDPVADIRATRSIRHVWCGGLEYTPIVSTAHLNA